MSLPMLSALLQTKKDTSRAKEAEVYLFDPNHPTELFHERQEALMREAREARLARQLRVVRRQERTTRERRTAWLPGRAIALWGCASVPFFRV